MCFLLPSQAAGADFSGVYVAPKFAVNLANVCSTELHVEGSGLNKKTGDFNDFLFSGALAVGYDFNPKFNVSLRTELEYSFFSQFSSTEDVTIPLLGTSRMKVEASIETFLVNIYYDFHNSTKFTPYIGLGLGIAFVCAGVDSEGYIFNEKTQINLAWQVGAGTFYAFTDNISLDLSYRYTQFGRAETEKRESTGQWISAKSTSAHQALLGIRYTF